MKLVLLIAGRGRRLEPAIGEMSKALVEFGGKTMTERIIGQFHQYGVNEIGLCVGYEAARIRARIGDHYLGCKVRYFRNKDYDETGAAWSLTAARTFFSGEECVIMEGDHLLHSKLVKKLLSAGGSHILVDDKTKPEYGEETVLLGKYSLSKELIWPASIIKEEDLELVRGEAVVMVKLTSKASRILATSLGRGEIIEPLNRVFRQAFVLYSSTDGLPWIEIDTPMDLKRAQSIYKECENV